ncbi:hypothetical protein JL722_2646 [Aureococcus anophagefferens]|nr:hypothetical protein JL722_2646 [Aureococcus anophagefferens]
MRAWYSIIIFFVWGLAPKASGQELAKLVASDAYGGDNFGWSVAVSGDLVVVGAIYHDYAESSFGSAYVFQTTNDGASWTETAKLVASDAAALDYFGGSVAVSGDLVVVGAFGNDDAGDWSGSAYVFRTTNDGASWTQTAKLVASDAAESDAFGYSVAVSGDLVAKLVASDAAASDYFVESVAVSGDLVVVGVLYNNDAGYRSGSAYVFRTTNGGASWTQVAKLVASDAAALDYFGTSSSGGGGGGGGGADTIVIAAAAVAVVVAVAIACLCIMRRRPRPPRSRGLQRRGASDRDDAAGGAGNVAAASTKTPATKTPVPSARYQQLMRDSEGVVARGMTAPALLTAGA